jgi:outer membrane protein OmpA-like peptidoglycan-associated protein
MKKVLLALLGLVLIGILTYFCFLDKIGSMRESLETNANGTLMSNNLVDAKAQLVGNDFETTTIMRLTGKVASDEEKNKAENLVSSVSGISSIDNQLVVENVIPALEPIVDTAPEIKVEEPIVDIPSPYLFDASKNKNGHVIINGYVDSEEAYVILIDQAHKIFGEQNVTNNVKVTKGAPENWDSVTYLGLTKLKDVDYGDIELHDNNYAFNGYISSQNAQEKKENILKDANATMSKFDKYTGNFEISIKTPKPKQVSTPEPVKKETRVKDSKLCQEALTKLSSKQKIYFKYDSAKIKKDSLNKVDNVVKLLKECKLKENEIVEIGGHTDSIGSYSYNKKLSQRRADSVKNYLIKKGIDKKTVISHGYGEKGHIASNMLKKGRAKNRRIEFKIKERK